MSILKKLLIYDENKEYYTPEERAQIVDSFENECNAVIKKYRDGK